MPRVVSSHKDRNSYWISIVVAAENLKIDKVDIPNLGKYTKYLHLREAFKLAIRKL